MTAIPVYNTVHLAAARRWKMSLNAACGANVNHQEARLSREMIIAIPVAHPGEGLRPIDISRDLSRVIELLRLVFGESLDSNERTLLGDSNPIDDLLFRMNPSAARLSHGFVWQADGRIVGNATLLPTKAWDRFLVANVAVHPSYRRQGIARHMMQAITESVSKRGGRVVLLQVVKDNASAINLYRSMGYTGIGNMTTWYGVASRLKEIPPGAEPLPGQQIEVLGNRRWREAYEVDTSHVHADLNWPEPLQPDAYRRTMWQRAIDFMNGRQIESWAAADGQDRLAGLASIYGEWGRSYFLSLRVRPEWAGQLERPLLAKVIRRLHYLPRRNVRVDHPEADEVTGLLLKESNFTVQRTLTHMRLDISR